MSRCSRGLQWKVANLSSTQRVHIPHRCVLSRGRDGSTIPHWESGPVVFLLLYHSFVSVP